MARQAGAIAELARCGKHQTPGMVVVLHRHHHPTAGAGRHPGSGGFTGHGQRRGASPRTPFQTLLRALVQRNGTSAYLEQLLAACGPPVAVEHSPALRPQQPRIPEILTHRAYEILTLLAERWSNQEIADRLVITVNTVRKHTSTIYDKLGVNSRREAVAAARALGLLPASSGE